MLDFSKEQEQREFVAGPVPAGSIVMVELEVLQPKEDRQAKDNPYISVAQTGLRQIYCQFTVSHGSYQGVHFRQNITLPMGGQNCQLNGGQQKACNIGGATLKAICLAAKKRQQIGDVKDMTGWRFPVRVKINQTPTRKDDGREFWNNELGAVITPDKEDYASVCHSGEVISGGPVTGNAASPSRSTRTTDSGQEMPGWDIPPCTDDCPF